MTEIIMKVTALFRHAKKVEQRTPMLSYKTLDEMSQVKRFILVYYLPILTKIDIE